MTVTAPSELDALRQEILRLREELRRERETTFDGDTSFTPLRWVVVTRWARGDAIETVRHHGPRLVSKFLPAETWVEDHRGQRVELPDEVVEEIERRVEEDKCKT